MNINRDCVRDYFHKLMKKINLEDDFNALNICNLEEIADSVNLERLANNPKSLDKNDLLHILKY